MRGPIIFGLFNIVLGVVLLKYGINRLKSDNKYESVQATRKSTIRVRDSYRSVYEADECSNSVLHSSRFIPPGKMKVDRHKETGKCTTDNENISYFFILFGILLLLMGLALFVYTLYKYYEEYY